MNVALDATYSLGDHLSGVGVYSRELLYGLAGAHPEARFSFCYRSHRFLRSFRRPLPANAHRFLLTETRVPQKADIFHCLNQRVPKQTPPRTICTFHDLFVLTGDYSTPEFRARFAEQARQAADRSDRIIAVSEFTATQVHELLRVPRERIRVIHHGVRIPARRAETREKIVLHVGAIQRRKNIVRLVEAFEKLDSDWVLVLAGGAGYGSQEILARIGASPHRDRIRILGYVSDAELEGWYARAMVFAFPSLDEGFGMPVLDAMAAGVPVVTSRSSALPEVAGDAAWLVDPNNSGEIADALQQLTRDPEKRAAMGRRGLLRISQFSWRKAVEETWQVYGELAG